MQSFSFFLSPPPYKYARGVPILIEASLLDHAKESTHHTNISQFIKENCRFTSHVFSSKILCDNKYAEISIRHRKHSESELIRSNPNQTNFILSAGRE
jgi:hypothetical protein